MLFQKSLVETTFPMLLMSGTHVHQCWHRVACAKTNVSLAVHPGCPDTRPGSLVRCRAVWQRWWERFGSQTKENLFSLESGTAARKILYCELEFLKRNCSHVLSPLLWSAAASVSVVNKPCVGQTAVMDVCCSFTLYNYAPLCINS